MQGSFNWFKNWYPVAIAEDLDPLKPFATKLLGVPMPAFQKNAQAVLVRVFTCASAACLCSLRCSFLLLKLLCKKLLCVSVKMLLYSDQRVVPFLQCFRSVTALRPLQSEPGGVLAGKDMVVWRDRDGEWRCFEDKCPHRYAAGGTWRVLVCPTSTLLGACSYCNPFCSLLTLLSCWWLVLWRTVCGCVRF